MAAENTSRRHTGRRRNEEVRQAILDAAMRLLAAPGAAPSAGAAVTVDAVAREAGVGKQTIYRWWPSKGAMFLDALSAHADELVPEADSGDLSADLAAFVTASFLAASTPTTSRALTKLAREAAHDAHLAAMMGQFTQRRREALHAVLARGRARGELAADADLALMADQIFGVLWYRLLVGHGVLDQAVARRLAASLIAGNAT